MKTLTRIEYPNGSKTIIGYAIAFEIPSIGGEIVIIAESPELLEKAAERLLSGERVEAPICLSRAQHVSLAPIHPNQIFPTSNQTPPQV